MSVNASKLVQIVPRVIDSGTAGLSFSGLFLTQSSLPPAGRVLQFSSAEAVGAYFGSSSEEASLATQYFNGYVNTSYLPSVLFFAPWAQEAVSAWLRGAEYTGELSALQAVVAGSLSVSIDNEIRTVSNLNFSGASSYSAVAQIIQQGLSSAEVPATSGTLTGGEISSLATAFQSVSAGKLDITVDGEVKNLTDLNFSEVNDLSDIASVLQTALSGAATVTVQNENSLQIVSATTGTTSSVGFASNPEQETQAEPTPSTDLAGALALTEATGAQSVPGQNASTPPGPSVTYSSQTGAFQITSPTTGADSEVSYAQGDVAQLLNLTEQTGAVQSVGSDAVSLTDCMTNILNYARDWVSFSTVFEPELAQKVELAQWCASYDTRFVYVMWDTDNSAQVQGSTASAGYIINFVQELDGTCCVYNTAQLAAGVMGAIACLNFDQREGRTTLAYRQFEGMGITCDNDGQYDALIANGYNCYADFATASAQFKFFQNGQVSGKFDWLDTYLNAVAIKDALQLNILDLFAAMKSVPYNDDGYAAIRTACLDTINRFLNFGAIRTGVTLSNTQKVQLLAEIGQDVSQTLESLGWYMQITDPGAVVRGQRQTPNCAFYYMDGGSVQQIIMSSTVIQ